MWKLVNGKLVHMTDPSRVKFRTNISKGVLEQLRGVAEENDTYVNYLLETGLERVLAEDIISFNKEARPKDRIQYKTAYDRKILEETRNFAKKHGVFINDVIEYSANKIDIDKVKDKTFKNRIEKA